MCDEEAKERQSLLGRYRNLEHEYDGVSTVYDEEVTAKVRKELEREREREREREKEDR